MSLCNSKPFWNCSTWRFIRRYRCPICQKLKTMVKRSIDQKLRLRNFDARHGKIETGAVVKSPKGLSGFEGGKGTCYQWKGKASVRQETSAVSGMRVTIVRKNQNPKPPHFLSHQCHKVEVCRGKGVSEARVTWCHSSTTVQKKVKSVGTTEQKKPKTRDHSPKKKRKRRQKCSG